MCIRYPTNHCLCMRNVDKQMAMKQRIFTTMTGKLPRNRKCGKLFSTDDSYFIDLKIFVLNTTIESIESRPLQSTF